MEAKKDKEQFIKALEINEQRYKDILNKTNACIWETDENFITTYCSDKIHDIAGYLPEEVIGKNIFQTLAPKISEEVKSKSSTQNSVKDFEAWITPSNGKKLYISTTCEPFFDNYGIFGGFRGIIRDISAYKTTEEHLEKEVLRNKSLTALSHDLIKKLKTVKMEAETTNQAKSEFMANINHEIIPHVNTIIEMSELLRTAKSKLKKDEYLQILQESVKNILIITGNTPVICKAEAEKVVRKNIENEMALPDNSPKQQDSPKCRILLVDDDKFSQIILSSYLEDMDCEIDTAENEKTAVYKFLIKEYDIVIMDIQMPEIEGYSAIKIIRDREKNNGLKPVPIIALTSKAVKEDITKKLASGFNNHIVKPVKPKDLIRIINSYMNSAKKHKTSKDNP